MDEFKRINMQVTSEMFLSIMILLQNSLPCTENFFRYQKNFEKYISTEDEANGGAQQDDGQTETSEDGGTQRPSSGGKVKTIASPRMMTNSPLASLAKQHGINFNPSGTKNMLQFAANRQPQGAAGAATQQPEEEEEKK